MNIFNHVKKNMYAMFLYVLLKHRRKKIYIWWFYNSPHAYEY